MNDYFVINTYKQVNTPYTPKKGMHPALILSIFFVLALFAAIISYFLVSGKTLSLQNVNLPTLPLTLSLSSPSPSNISDYSNPFIEDNFTVNPFLVNNDQLEANIFDQFDANLAKYNNKYENPF